MELRDLAIRVLTSPELATKLAPAGEALTDSLPGAAMRWSEPARSTDLQIEDAVKIPSIEGMHDPAQRRRILHALANHELQAAELFAWALLAFPDAPEEMRRGLVKILDDEQRHTRMYIARLEANDGRFGEQPLSGYFWHKVEAIETPLDFLCAMSLTFENANLDHTVDNAAAARRGGDDKTARVIEQVHRDEIEHVSFGWTWLQRLKRPEDSAWQAYTDSLSWPLRPARARGVRFYPEGRRAAGLDDEFIDRLEEWVE